MVHEVVQDFLHPQYDGCSKFPIGGPPWVAAATTCHLGFRVSGFQLKNPEGEQIIGPQEK